MSEHINLLEEEKRESEHILTAPETQERLTATVEESERASEDQEGPVMDVETAKEKVSTAVNEADGKSADPFKAYDEQTRLTRESASPRSVNRELKDLTLVRTLTRIRKREPAPDRVLSKVIHQPIVRTISEGTSKTLSRPSGLLGGGIMAFIGSTAYVYFARHEGVPYNYLLFILFFVGGFMIGLLLELIIWATGRRTH